MDGLKDIGKIVESLGSKQKLERDKSLNNLINIIPSCDSSFLKCLLSSFICVLKNPEVPWESYHGILLASSKLLTAQSVLCIEEENMKELREGATLLLNHSEVRVRLAAGEALGCLCRKDGGFTYTTVKPKILHLIQSNLERDVGSESENSFDSDVAHSPGSELRKRRESGNAEQIFHDTAGWRNLETSMKCLESMVLGSGPQFIQFVEQELLELIFTALKHTNRFVRETGFSVCSALVDCGFDEGELSTVNPILAFGDQLASHLALGLSDNWSQVRLASSVATRKFLVNLPSAAQQKFFPVLLPRICLNRYYVAEGVRLYSQETWRLVTENEGRTLVERHISFVVPYYVDSTVADNHAVREAACVCIAELAMKIPKAALVPYIDVLLQALITCFSDDSWPVRDAACLACGNYISCFPDESSQHIDQILPLFFGNLQDNIPSVRQGAASALLKVTKAYQDRIVPQAIDWIKNSLEGVKQQPSESQRYESLESGPASFGVAKQLRDNDIELHSNQQMYSCGSLAPKMGRGGGGCSGGHFRRPVQEWEKADGALYLIAEFSSIPQLSEQIARVLPLVASTSSLRHYSAHHSFLDTLCQILPIVAKGIGKKLFKINLSLFYDSIFYALASENARTSSSAQECLEHFSKFLGPNILKGRLEEHNPEYVSALESAVRGIP